MQIGLLLRGIIWYINTKLISTNEPCTEYSFIMSLSIDTHHFSNLHSHSLPFRWKWTHNFGTKAALLWQKLALATCYYSIIPQRYSSSQPYKAYLTEWGHRFWRTLLKIIIFRGWNECRLKCVAGYRSYRSPRFLRTTSFESLSSVIKANKCCNM